MRRLLLLIGILLFSKCLLSQRYKVDTLPGYIIRVKDTINGKVTLTYKMSKGKKEYEEEEWYQQVTFIAPSGAEKIFTPKEIAAYGWSWNDTLKATFRAFKVDVPHKDAYQFKGQATPFLKVEIEGPMSLYLYYHRENAPNAIHFYSDRYLKNEKGEIQPLKIKMLFGIAYNLTELENWFYGYPELSKFNLKDMVPFQVWLLVKGYNEWKNAGKR